MATASHKSERDEVLNGGPGELRVIVLRHTTGDDHHFDWMFEIGIDDQDGLETWRCTRRPDLARSGDFMRAERLDDHRRAYLEYEGEISGGRGEVQRVSHGSYRAEPADARPAAVPTGRVIHWSSGITQRWSFEPDGIRCVFSGGDPRD